MIRVYLNSDGEGCGFEDLKNKMIQICNKHRGSDRALAFAFILYDFRNPQLRKILRDRDYWLALDQITGEYLTVFSLHYRKKKSKGPRVSTYDNLSSATDSLIQKYFNGIKANYPAILFFQVSNDSVVDSLLIDLKEEEIEEGFSELKEYLERAVKALERITPGNKKNYREIFNCLEAEVKSVKRAKNIIRVANKVRDIASLIKLISGIVRP